MYVSYIPFEVPCESNTQNADNKRLKIGMHIDIRETITTALEDLYNPKFPHSVYLSNHILLS